MNVNEWLKGASKEERENVSSDAGTSVDYLWQLSGGHRRPSPALAAKLELATKKYTPDRVLCKQALIFGDNNTEAA